MSLASVILCVISMGKLKPQKERFYPKKTFELHNSFPLTTEIVPVIVFFSLSVAMWLLKQSSLMVISWSARLKCVFTTSDQDIATFLLHRNLILSRMSSAV